MVIYTEILATPQEQARVARYYSEQAADVYRIIAHFTRNPADAEDLFHNIFVNVMKNPAPFFRMESESPKALRNYLMKTAYNACIDEVNKRKKEQGNMSLDDLVDLPAPEELDTSQTGTLCFRDMIKILPAQQQEIFYLHLEFGESLRDIAKAKEIPESTIKSRFSRARAKVANYIREVDFNEASK